MTRPGDPKLDRLAELAAQLAGATPDELRAQWGVAAAPPPPRTPELGPAARAAIADAHARRLAASGEAAEPARPGERRRIAPRRNPAPPVPERSERRRRFEAALRAGGSSLELMDWSAETYAMSARVMRRGARGALEVLASLPPEYARRVRSAALLVARDAGEPRTWGSIAARRTLIYATALYRCSRRVRRRPGFASVVVGVTVGMIAALVPNPQTGAPYSRSALVGVLRDGRDPAPLRALAEAGAWVRIQPPASTVPPHLRGTDRHGEERAVGQFWFTERVVTETESSADGATQRPGARQRRRAGRTRAERPPD